MLDVLQCTFGVSIDSSFTVKQNVAKSMLADLRQILDDPGLAEMGESVIPDEIRSRSENMDDNVVLQDWYSLMNFNRPDFSSFVVHFTKDATPISTKQKSTELTEIAAMTAKDRLFSILKNRRVQATRMPWTNKRAVCFTECTWPSLLGHAQRYSPYGVGFKKEFLFGNGGGPAFYMPPHLLKRQQKYVGQGKHPFDPELFAFLTPFTPFYAQQSYKDEHWEGKSPVDFSHEREWRVPRDLEFSADHVQFVLVDTYEDMAQAPKDLKDSVGREKWIIMSVYRRIEEIWPTHQLPE